MRKRLKKAGPVLKDLAERRERLVKRSGEQRQLVSTAAGTAAQKLVLVNSATAFLQRIGWRPVMLGGALVASLAIGPRRAMTWASRASALYSAFRQARRLLGAHP